MRWSWLALVLAAVAPAACGSPVFSPTGPSPTTTRYLAFGDSLTAGTLADGTVTAQAYPAVPRATEREDLHQVRVRPGTPEVPSGPFQAHFRAPRKIDRPESFFLDSPAR